MQQLDVRIPRRTCLDSRAERMILRKTDVVRAALVRESQGAGGHRIPRMRGNDVERGLQLQRNQVIHGRILTRKGLELADFGYAHAGATISPQLPRHQRARSDGASVAPGKLTS